ncbi:MAG: biopolymer transporter ExbD [Microcoleus sp. PH2017_29_MFU_D_A]|jgi:biopolymer transport protein ExbD|uniref:ExbD/TolR family protein n=1 Tax=unclassified Microcoleus TaxID=2642155 RepID=UPI001DF5A57D|nr:MULTISPECIES: biopolymer transporter ExbD [unclassified Microcoleus]MCC3420284.1 biopolymer transporter ExbD [Microcoleus sp. PH2017_07_MST_O_A]MCC3445130.1 biopolymer transporter ExbD [Microcoleus sp. PH2017_03_ELD_O_A]MCC3504200.1 biopolymer transporter ExbD [Microcoleus sp. PH2017_19_SFW_U_A]MCC3510769.1 biopolymer transporter ExbD [Microcoleus sp. PH2017_17_BER_D_A]TAE13321.1 MAG: biopolymer transporter ExbD [Oscillatoriales cyanobacterium]
MKIHLDTPAEEARIELVPLIDVIFCILTFFLVAALQLTRQQAINVDLPKAKTGQTQMREMLIVSIDDFGQTYIDQLPVNYQQLDRVLKSFHSTNPAGLTVLYAPQNAKYAKVVEVLDKLREVGGDRVALATLPSSAPSAQPNNPSLPNSGIPAAPSGNYPQPLPSPVAPGQQQLNPNRFQSPLPAPGQQQFNPNQFQSPLPAPGQQPSNSGGNLGIPPVSPAPIAPNSRPGAATPPPNVPPSN